MLIRYFESEKITAGSRAGWAGPTSLGRSMALDYNGLSESLFTENKNCPPLSDARLDFLRLTHFQVKNIDLHFYSIWSFSSFRASCVWTKICV